MGRGDLYRRTIISSLARGVVQRELAGREGGQRAVRIDAAAANGGPRRAGLQPPPP